MEIVAQDKLGKARRIDDAIGRYVEFCKASLPVDVNLRGLKVVLDCANGTTYHTAPKVFRELGAKVIELSVEPNGLNINEACGATDLKTLQKVVVDKKADLGIALDGDGDRVMMVDHRGEIVDGDEILFIITSHRFSQGKLPGGVVGTLMSNYGLELAYQELGIPFKRAKVGDRYVMEMLDENDWQFGGESSGHIICLNKTTTGAGIVAGLQVLCAIQQSGKNLASLKQGMKKLPQIMINVPIQDKSVITAHKGIQVAIASATEALAGKGRVLLRPSGTEPLARVMVEGEDIILVEALAKQLAEVVIDAK
jgi:phosphoglucosamine mutase